MDMSFLYGATGGGVVGVIAAVLGWIMMSNFQRILAERDRLAEARLHKIESDITSLGSKIETKTAEVDKKLASHTEKDNPELVAEQLKNLTEAIKQSTSLQRHSELTIGEIQQNLAKVTTKLEDDIKAKDKWLHNLNTDFQAHVNDRSKHHGT